MGSSLIYENVLVLNKFFLAIQVTIVKEAVCALVTGKAKIVDEYYTMHDLEQWKAFTKTFRDSVHPRPAHEPWNVLRSPSTTILVPQVIIIPDCEFNSPLIKTIKYSRRNIYQRDKNTCQYCGKKVDRKNLTLDHVVPKSRGGKSSWINVVTSCIWCNSDKGDKLLKELGWQLKKQPTRPRWKSHVGVPFSKTKKEYWEKFLE